MVIRWPVACPSKTTVSKRGRPSRFSVVWYQALPSMEYSSREGTALRKCLTRRFSITARYTDSSLSTIIPRSRSAARGFMLTAQRFGSTWRMVSSTTPHPRSRSMRCWVRTWASSTRRPWRASTVARAAETVVLPTPPLPPMTMNCIDHF